MSSSTSTPTFSEEQRKIIEEELFRNKLNAEKSTLLNNIAIDKEGVSMRIFADESSAVTLLLKMLNLAPSYEEFNNIILPWLRERLPYLHKVYQDNKDFFDLMAPKIVGAATIGIGIYKLKNYLSTYFGFNSPPPGTRKRGRPRKYEYVE